jgi:hypothetical protein
MSPRARRPPSSGNRFLTLCPSFNFWRRHTHLRGRAFGADGNPDHVGSETILIRQSKTDAAEEGTRIYLLWRRGLIC